MANGTLAASQLEMLSQDGTGIITITPPATNTNRAITLPDAAGAIVVSGTTPSLNGIAFPATQVASANANTLDDYEEGTWTPKWVDVSGNEPAYSTQSASYVKIGRTVFIACSLRSDGISLSGRVRVENLPFPRVGDPGALSLSIMRRFAINSTTIRLGVSGTSVIVYKHATNDFDVAELQGSDFDSSTFNFNQFQFSGVYTTD